MFSKKLHHYSVFLLSCAFLLIIAGGLVTSTGSGLSVPDWPLSYGQVFPPMIGGIRFEHSHRVIAGTVGILTFILTVLILKLEKRRWVRTLGILASLAIVLQAVLGGLTVIYLLPMPVSVAHACLGQSFFTLLAVITLVTSRAWIDAKKDSAENAGSLQRLALITSVFVYLQLILGAVVRHSGGKAVPWHIGVAFLVLLHVLLTNLKINRLAKDPGGLSQHALLLGALVLVQMALGLGAYYHKLVLERTATPGIPEVLFATAHQSTGALILALSVTLTLRSFRLLSR